MQQRTLFSGKLTGQMAYSTARVASLLAVAAAATVATGLVTAAVGSATLGAVAGNVANLAALEMAC